MSTGRRVSNQKRSPDETRLVSSVFVSVTTFRTRGHHGRFHQRTSVIITTTKAYQSFRSLSAQHFLPRSRRLNTHGLELARSLLGIPILPPPVSLSVPTSRSPVGAVSAGTSLPGRRLSSDGLLVGLGDDLAGEVEELFRSYVGKSMERAG